ncbi:MAG: hypothetical protein Q8R51_14135, partial [Azonexus sp.]|nr:hypothetical protein [Azonexus sp.]
MSRVISAVCGTLAALTIIPAFDQGFNGVLFFVSLSFAFIAFKAYSAFNKEEAINKTEQEIKYKAKAKLQSLTGQSSHKPLLAVHVGGSGFAVGQGAAVYLSSRIDKLAISNAIDENEVEIPIKDISAIEISGPGTQTTSASVIGGGFGLEGAAKGMIAATLINAATTKSTTNTFLRIATNKGEAHFHFNDIEP